jgi:[acyl-carrier-protein] S-malonyltransferase
LRKLITVSTNKNQAVIAIKTAFVFSGQGAQFHGMGKELYDNFSICKDVFDEADDALSLKLSTICFDEEKLNDLNRTEFCQPAILTLSTACFRLLSDAGFQADAMAGLSLGEYSALTSGGAFLFRDAVRLVRKRGQFMAEAVPEGQGAMSAILGLSAAALEKACLDAAPFGIVVCANYNAPGQIVIAGTTAAVAEAEKYALAAGASRAVRLQVSGAFHTELMRPAAERLAEALNKTPVHALSVPVISNTDAQAIPSRDAVIPTLLKQIVSPVRWSESVENMIAAGVDTFIELGPGKTLSSFIKKINRDVNIYNIQDIKSYEKTLNGLQ